MTAETVTRWSRAFVAVGVGLFVCWYLAVLAGYPRAATLSLGLYGFVCSVIFGKAYALVPSYFARQLALERAPAVHLPLATGGVLALFAAAAGLAPSWIGDLGALSWLAGCLVFVGALVWTVRDNPTGHETATGGTDTHRRQVDRYANAVVPLVLVYLLVGAVLPVLEFASVNPAALGVPSSGPPASHLLAAGVGALLVFGIGFRLLPRFLVASPRPWLVAVVLPAGAIAPALLAVDFLGGAAFRLGAALQALAVTAFAVAVADMYRRSDRRRVGFYGVLAGAVAGVAAVALGLTFALPDLLQIGGAEATTAHYRLAVGGFLGLTIVGVSFQFYPPAVASARGIGDRTAVAAITALAGGLVVEVGGLLTGTQPAVTAGVLIGLVGAVLYATVVYTVFLERR